MNSNQGLLVAYSLRVGPARTRMVRLSSRSKKTELYFSRFFGAVAFALLVCFSTTGYSQNPLRQSGVRQILQIGYQEPIDGESESLGKAERIDSAPEDLPLPSEETLNLNPADEEYLDPIPSHRGPRTIKVNPLAVQQGVANLAFQGDEQISRDQLGFPFSWVPPGIAERVPRLDFGIDFPEGRHIGRGYPLEGTSWRNRPLHVDVFSGGLFASDLISGDVEQGNGFITGTRLGWDTHHYFGTELRLAMSETSILGTDRKNDVRFLDVNMLYYPWGDSRFRPYTSLGMGVATFNFVDNNGLGIGETMFHLPIGIGMKYYFRHALSLRMEFTDNIAFGSDTLDVMNNFSLTAGMELRFGGKRRSYYPYQSSKYIW